MNGIRYSTVSFLIFIYTAVICFTCIKADHAMAGELSDKDNLLIGVISDTHGILAPEIEKVMKNVDFIIHAGDIDSPEILESLRSIAPVVAVRGNMDYGKWADKLNQTETVKTGKVKLYVLHIIGRLDIDPEAEGYDAVIYGHTHMASSKYKNNVLYLNPGSATHPKHDNPSTIALLHVMGGVLDVEFVEVK